MCKAKSLSDHLRANDPPSGIWSFTISTRANTVVANCRFALGAVTEDCLAWLKCHVLAWAADHFGPWRELEIESNLFRPEVEIRLTGCAE